MQTPNFGRILGWFSKFQWPLNLQVFSYAVTTDVIAKGCWLHGPVSLFTTAKFQALWQKECHAVNWCAAPSSRMGWVIAAGLDVWRIGGQFSWPFWVVHFWWSDPGKYHGLKILSTLCPPFNQVVNWCAAPSSRMGWVIAAGLDVWRIGGQYIYIYGLCGMI